MFERLTEAALLDGTVELDLAVTAERSFPGPRLAHASTARTTSRSSCAPTRSATPTRSSTRRSSTGSRPGSSTTATASGRGRVPGRRRGSRSASRSRARAAEVYVDMEEPILIASCAGRRRRDASGSASAAPDLQVARFEYATCAAPWRPARRHSSRRRASVRAWLVSDTFAESAPSRATGRRRARGRGSRRSRTGLLDLARANAIGGDRNTVFARTTIPSDRAQTRSLELGFSDRAVVFLNGRAALPRRRHLPLARLPLPRQHRLVRHALPAARRGRQRAGRRGLGGLRRLGQAPTPRFG